VARTYGTTLIVGTDEDQRSALSKLLRRAGFDSLEAESGEEALETVRAEQPWLVVLDVALPDVSGFQLCRELREEFGEKLSIVFISGERTHPIDRTTGLLVGGDDYIVEPFDPGELLARVRRLDERRRAEQSPARWLEPDVSTLTHREIDVLRLLAAGSRTREISLALGISVKTVSSHVQHLLSKLGVNTRAQAVAFAYRHGLVTAGEEAADEDVVAAGRRR
jgi:two-component system, OmpR family, response regulator